MEHIYRNVLANSENITYLLLLPIYNRAFYNVDTFSYINFLEWSPSIYTTHKHTCLSIPKLVADP